jgi:hypothetical protein
MRHRRRFALAALVLALLVVLVGAPVPPPSVLADDAVRIDSPATGASVSGQVEVRGRATTADPSRFSFYRLHYGSGSSPSTLRPIGSAGDQPVDGGLLGVWDTAPLLAGEYTLSLTVYDTSGATTVARVVVNVLPAPTPTLRTNQPPLVVVTPGPTSTTDEEGPTPTPIPELPQLVPQIPQIDVPQPDQGQAPIQPVNPQPSDTDVQPITITGPNPANAAPPPLPPGVAPGPQTGNQPFDPGAGSVPLAPIDSNPPSSNPINPVGPPPAPVVAPYEPPPGLPTAVPPTPFGIPP